MLITQGNAVDIENIKGGRAEAVLTKKLRLQTAADKSNLERSQLKGKFSPDWIYVKILDRGY
jgi:hypothetical protein